MRRHEARERALQALYQIDVGKVEVTPAIHHVLEDESNITDVDLSYVTRLVVGTRSEIDTIDTLLSTHVQGWQLDRIARVDLNVLRLALYELLHESDVDTATIVDEAVELAKSFGSETSSKFVNGVLAKLLPVVAASRN